MFYNRRLERPAALIIRCRKLSVDITSRYGRKPAHQTTHRNLPFQSFSSISSLTSLVRSTSRPHSTRKTCFLSSNTSARSNLCWPMILTDLRFAPLDALAATTPITLSMSSGIQPSTITSSSNSGQTTTSDEVMSGCKAWMNMCGVRHARKVRVRRCFMGRSAR